MKDNKKKLEFEQSEIDFGERKISQMNFSFIVTIPKKFVKSTQFDRTNEENFKVGMGREREGRLSMYQRMPNQ